MGLEIERKFLVVDPSILDGKRGTTIMQGYFTIRTDLSVRIRLMDDKGFITIKRKTTESIVRREYEYEIPAADAMELLSQFPIEGRIEKIRFDIYEDDTHWTVDRFLGENDGLFLAEIELVQPDQVITIPSWVGAEVSDDEHYTNAFLSLHPFHSWK